MSTRALPTRHISAGGGIARGLGSVVRPYSFAALDARLAAGERIFADWHGVRGAFP
jgi:hypothetical protein